MRSGLLFSGCDVDQFLISTDQSISSPGLHWRARFGSEGADTHSQFLSKTYACKNWRRINLNFFMQNLYPDRFCSQRPTLGRPGPRDSEGEQIGSLKQAHHFGLNRTATFGEQLILQDSVTHSI